MTKPSTVACMPTALYLQTNHKYNFLVSHKRFIPVAPGNTNCRVEKSSYSITTIELYSRR